MKHFLQALILLTTTLEMSTTTAAAQQTGNNTKEQQTAYRIVNRQAGGGFVIMADDETESDIIGYSDEGNIDPGNLPPAMKDWLENYRKQGDSSKLRAARRAADIAPLLTTRWSQRWPYNRMAPEYAEGSNCAAGCLAVAMAQIMKYWATDAWCYNIPAYRTETLGIEVEALPARRFNYSIMRDSYGMFDWDESAQEVAALMRYCGQAAEMDYDVYSGATTSGKYLANYFGFKNSYTDKYHAEHMSGWEDLLYSELKAGRPMLYSGKKINGSGHVFVVDGYQDGYFHINWGWDEGNGNGYYKITLANPDDPDSAALWEGYRWMQMAVIGLEPVSTTAIQMPDLPHTPSERGTLFDLQGRRISKPQAKGLYISNGKKVVYH